MLLIFFNKKVLLSVQEIILFMNGTNQFIKFFLLLHVEVGKKRSQVILLITSIIITRRLIFSGGVRFNLLLFAVLCHEALVADVGEEKPLGDGDVGGVLVGGGLGGALVGVPLLANMVSGTIIRGTLKTPNSQLVTPISIKLQRPDGYD